MILSKICLKHIPSAIFLALSGSVVLSGCLLGEKPSPRELPSMSILGEIRGKHIERVITHFHTPYSFDACDGHGLTHTPDGKAIPNKACEEDLERAICLNRINSIFVSDHMNNMAPAPFEDLLFTHDPAQEIIASEGLSKGQGVARKVHCENGHEGFFAPGLEGRLLALGMTRHMDGDEYTRREVYGADTAWAVQNLQLRTEAVVVMPHTESKSLKLIEEAKPDAMEIYNLHANFDPTIREQFLGIKPYSHLPAFGDYLADAYEVLDPDYLFMEFVQFFPQYFEKWDHAIADGLHLTGLGGTDSHENVFSERMKDGERLDSYRRMSRFMSHFLLIDTPKASNTYQNYLATKDALKKGRVYFVIEGLGTPVGFDFTAYFPTHEHKEGTVKEMGDTVEAKDKPVLVFQFPTVYSESPGIKEFGQPKIRIELIQVDAHGIEKVVSQATRDVDYHGPQTQKLVYPDPAPGAYRVKVMMVPSHLRRIVRRNNFTEREYVWMITNHIYVR